MNASSPGVLVREGRHPAGSDLPRHVHATPSFCYVLGGAFHEEVPGGRLTCQAHSLKFTPAGMPHANRFDLGDARGLMVEVAPTFVERLAPCHAALDEPRQFVGGVACVLAGALAREVDLGGPGNSVGVEALVAELVAAAGRHPPEVREAAGARWLVRAREILEEAPGEVRGLAELADRVGVHPVTLARAFRRRYRCAVGEYLRQRRVGVAAELLTTSEEPLSRIAVLVGFADQSHFTRVFRRETGWTPSRWRRGLAPGANSRPANGVARVNRPTT